MCLRSKTLPKDVGFLNALSSITATSAFKHYTHFGCSFTDTFCVEFLSIFFCVYSVNHSAVSHGRGLFQIFPPAPSPFASFEQRMVLTKVEGEEVSGITPSTFCVLPVLLRIAAYYHILGCITVCYRVFPNIACNVAYYRVLLRIFAYFRVLQLWNLGRAAWHLCWYAYY